MRASRPRWPPRRLFRAVRVGKSFRVPEKAVHTYLENAYFDAG
jgi:hypothetical protein